MSELRTHSLRHNTATGDPNIEMYADGSTSIRNLQQLGTNYLINGGCLINQRDTGSAYEIFNQSNYTLDRWRARNNGTPPTTSVSQIDLTTAPPAPGLIRAIRLQNSASNPAAPLANDYVGVTQMLEQSSSRALGFGSDDTQDVSVSFWVRSSLAATYTMSFISPNNQWSYLHDFTVAANTWTYVSHTFKASDSSDFLATGDTAGGVVFGVYLAAGSNFTNSTTDAWVNSEEFISTKASNNFSTTPSATVDFTGFCLTATSQPVVMPLESYETTLAKCKRYFQRLNAIGFVMPKTGLNSEFRGSYFLTTDMRAGPNVIRTPGSGGSLKCQPGGQVASGLAFSWVRPDRFQIYVNGNTAFNSQTFEDSVSLDVSAEF